MVCVNYLCIVFHPYQPLLLYYWGIDTPCLCGTLRYLTTPKHIRIRQYSHSNILPHYHNGIVTLQFRNRPTKDGISLLFKVVGSIVMDALPPWCFSSPTRLFNCRMLLDIASLMRWQVVIVCYAVYRSCRCFCYGLIITPKNLDRKITIFFSAFCLPWVLFPIDNTIITSLYMHRKIPIFWCYGVLKTA